MRSSDESMRPGPQARTPNVELRLSLVRDGTLLPLRFGHASQADEIPAAEILQAVRAVADRSGELVIGGGDPLRRGDLLEILQGLTRLRPANLGLCLTGRGLTPPIVQRLQAAGV